MGSVYTEAELHQMNNLKASPSNAVRFARAVELVIAEKRERATKLAKVYAASYKYGVDDIIPGPWTLDVLTGLRAVEQAMMESLVIKWPHGIRRAMLGPPGTGLEVYDPVLGPFSKADEWTVDTDRSNLRDVLGHPHMDSARTVCNDVYEATLLCCCGDCCAQAGESHRCCNAHSTSALCRHAHLQAPKQFPCPVGEPPWQLPFPFTLSLP